MTEPAIVDYYSDFEGEPEIAFIRRSSGDTMGELRMWNGYFETIMQAVRPGPKGWSSLALHFNMDTGWNDEPWRVDNLAEALKQLQELDREDVKGDFRNKAIEALDALIRFLHDARLRRQEVIIESR